MKQVAKQTDTTESYKEQVEAGFEASLQDKLAKMNEIFKQTNEEKKVEDRVEKEPFQVNKQETSQSAARSSIPNQYRESSEMEAQHPRFQHISPPQV